jgi:hypothetical protein
MKLIIENIDGVLYAYTESKSHFQAASKSRSTRQIDPAELDNECNLSAYGKNFHMVFDLKKQK